MKNLIPWMLALAAGPGGAWFAENIYGLLAGLFLTSGG
jgi:hypothetical protein